MNPEQAKMIDYIDKVMSIPSCRSSASSKVNMLNKWMNLSTTAPKRDDSNEDDDDKEITDGHANKADNQQSGGRPRAKGKSRKKGEAKSKSAKLRRSADKVFLNSLRGAASRRPFNAAGGPRSLFMERGLGSNLDLSHSPTRLVQSAPSGGGSGNAAAAAAAAAAALDWDVRKILGKIPVATDERVFAKYKCNHHL